MMIEARDLRKSFGKVCAVDGVSFAAHAGEVFGVLSPNGAGKTTTLRMLATTIRPDGGTATVRGHDIAVLVFKEALVGTPAVSHVLLTILSMLLFCLVAVLVTLRTFGNERVLPRS